MKLYILRDQIVELDAILGLQRISAMGALEFSLAMCILNLHLFLQSRVGRLLYDVLGDVEMSALLRPVETRNVWPFFFTIQKLTFA